MELSNSASKLWPIWLPSRDDEILYQECFHPYKCTLTLSNGDYTESSTNKHKAQKLAQPDCKLFITASRRGRSTEGSWGEFSSIHLRHHVHPRSPVAHNPMIVRGHQIPLFPSFYMSDGLHQIFYINSISLREGVGFGQGQPPV